MTKANQGRRLIQQEGRTTSNFRAIRLVSHEPRYQAYQELRIVNYAWPFRENERVQVMVATTGRDRRPPRYLVQSLDEGRKLGWVFEGDLK